MFGKNNKNTDKNSQQKTQNSPVLNNDNTSIFSTGIQIKGDIFGKSDLNIFGEFEGTITLKDNNVNIENSAKIKADISAKTICVDGSITGNMNASEKILVTKNGHIVGDITALKVELEDGSSFDGNISMIKNEKPNNNQKNNSK